LDALASLDFSGISGLVNQISIISLIGCRQPQPQQPCWLVCLIRLPAHRQHRPRR
jgi:hypothetical protein